MPATYERRDRKRRYEATPRGKVVHAIAKARRKLAHCDDPARAIRLGAILALAVAELRRISS